MASHEVKKHPDLESIVPVHTISHGTVSPLEDTFSHGMSRPRMDGMRTTTRGLKSRHVQLMAIGGSIGTALFVGIGNSLSRAGPLSLLLGYMFWGLGFIWPCNLYTAEMISYLPIKGQIFELASRYVDPAVGFALGWTYFFGGSMLVCVEHAAVAAVIQYWNTDINPAVWITISIVVCFTLNVAAVKWYGESEFIMASTKIILLLGLILLTFITMVGGNPRGDVYGFRYWSDGLAMHPYYATGAAGNFLGWWTCVRYAAFTIAGPDLITMAAGEMENPRKTIPRVARLVFYRLVGFYIVGVLAVGIICSSRDTGLLGAIESGASGAGASPWVIGIQNLGIEGLPSLINAVIMLSGLSCGNAYLYSTSRTLYSLAQDGQAPRFLLKCTKAGVPIYCVTIVTLLGCLTYMSSSAGAVTVFFWFVNLTTIAFVLVYTTYLVVWTRWDAALKAQGVSRDALPYKAPFAPYGAWFGITAGSLCMIFIGFDVFSPWDTEGFITFYFGLAFGLVMFVFWKVFKRTKWVAPEKADLYTGKAEVDEDCKRWESPEAVEKEQQRLAELTFWARLWERMW